MATMDSVTQSESVSLGHFCSRTHLLTPLCFLNCRRRKPTDRTLPSFAPAHPPSDSPGPTEKKIAASTESLQSLSASYKQLQEVERKLDWNVSRRKMELTEILTSGRAQGVRVVAQCPSHTLPNI